MLNLIQFLLAEEMGLEVVVHIADLIQNLNDVKAILKILYALVVELLKLLLSFEAYKTAKLIKFS